MAKREAAIHEVDGRGSGPGTRSEAGAVGPAGHPLPPPLTQLHEQSSKGHSTRADVQEP